MGVTRSLYLLKAEHFQQGSIQQQIKKLYDDVVSIKQISNRLNISYGSAWNYVQQFKNN